MSWAIRHSQTHVSLDKERISSFQAQDCQTSRAETLLHTHHCQDLATNCSQGWVLHPSLDDISRRSPDISSMYFTSALAIRSVWPDSICLDVRWRDWLRMVFKALLGGCCRGCRIRKLLSLDRRRQKRGLGCAGTNRSRGNQAKLIMIQLSRSCI